MSRQGVHRHLQTLLCQGVIIKLGSSRKKSFYLLNRPSLLKRFLGTQKTFKKTYRSVGLEEETVFQEVSRQPYLLTNLAKAGRAIFHFAFTEMVNNAIDHSASPLIKIEVASNQEITSFVVVDHGVGLFENVRVKKGLANELEAIQDLIKGKQTTMPEKHSGEGIFFTSKVADRLVIDSHQKSLIFDNRLPDIFVTDVKYRKGTRVSFEIANRTGKRLEEVFKEYTGEDFQFEKTKLTVKLFKTGDNYVSRSQAKRLVHSLEQFKEIILDFQGVETIGQGFADEIFRVFASQHPDINIVPIHCNENVQFMIRHVKAKPLG